MLCKKLYCWERRVTKTYSKNRKFAHKIFLRVFSSQNIVEICLGGVNFASMCYLFVQNYAKFAKWDAVGAKRSWFSHGWLNGQVSKLYVITGINIKKKWGSVFFLLVGAKNLRVTRRRSAPGKSCLRNLGVKAKYVMWKTILLRTTTSNENLDNKSLIRSHFFLRAFPSQNILKICLGGVIFA